MPEKLRAIFERAIETRSTAKKRPREKDSRRFSHFGLARRARLREHDRDPTRCASRSWGISSESLSRPRDEGDEIAAARADFEIRTFEIRIFEIGKESETATTHIGFVRPATFGVLLATMGLALTAPPARAQLADSLWPMFQHDPQHTGRGEVAGPQGPSPQLVWDFRPRSRARASVSVGEAAPGLDGDVYVGDGRNPLSAVDAATGEQIWFSTKRQGAIPDRSQPAVSADGSIFVGARDNDLWKIGADGSVLCRFHVTHDGDVTTSPTIARDGTVYMGSGALGGAWFYSMRPDCDGSTMIPNWLNKLGGSLENMSPALNHAEDVVFVSLKTEAVALHASDGSEKWRVPLARKGFGRTSNFSPSVANDGSAVYFNSKDGLYALDPETGATSWNFVPPHPDGAKQKEEIHVSPAIGGDGTLYFGASKGKKSSHFYALNPDGTIKWSRELFDKGQFRGTQAVIGVDAAGDDDLIYVGHGRFLLALEADTGAVRWTMFIPGRIESGPVLGAPGVLYLGVGAHLYKISD